MYAITNEHQLAHTRAGPWNQDHETLALGSKEASVTLKDLRPATVYKVRIIAQNALGKSAPCSELLIKTEDEGESMASLYYVSACHSMREGSSLQFPS